MSALSADRRHALLLVPAAALACAAAMLVSLVTLPGRLTPPTAASVRTGPASIPPAAQGPVSAALGRELPAYRVVGSAARNPAQGFGLRFARSGATVVSGTAKLGVALAAVGHGTGLQAVGAVAPRTSGNRVRYAHGMLTEWWANGPLGLEQGFDLPVRPAPGPGPLTLSLALSGDLRARIVGRTVRFDGRGASLAYGGLVATDARGRTLRSWLELDGARVLIRIDDRGAAYPLRVDPVLTQSAKLRPAHGARLSSFGWAVAASGDTIVVGAPDETDSFTAKGAAYVFVKPKRGWSGVLTQTGTLTASNRGAGDHFGSSVAVSGHTIVVGAPGPPRAPGVPPPAQRDAYVFVRPRSGWSGRHTETGRLTTTAPVAASYFGNSVAVSGDTVVVGAPGRPEGGRVDQGAAFVFARPRSGWAGTHAQTTMLTSSNGRAHDLFGWMVAASGDTIAVGAVQHRPHGAAYVFVRPRTGWAHAHRQTGVLRSPSIPGGLIGDSLAMSGDTIVSGSGGSYADNGLSGVAWAYVRPSSGWAGTHRPTAALKVPDRRTASSCGVPRDSGPAQDFGFSLAMSGDTIVGSTGAHGDDTGDYNGTVCAFSKPPTGWSGTITDATTFTAPDSAGGDLFGTGSRSTIAVSGTTVVAGAPNHKTRSGYGQAYVFETR